MHMKNDEHWNTYPNNSKYSISVYLSRFFRYDLSPVSPSSKHSAPCCPGAKNCSNGTTKKKVMQLQSIFHVHPFGQVVQRQSHNDRLSKVKHVGKLLESLVVGS